MELVIRSTSEKLSEQVTVPLSPSGLEDFTRHTQSVMSVLSFIAQPPKGYFTQDERKELIALMSGSRAEVLAYLNEMKQRDN